MKSKSIKALQWTLIVLGLLAGLNTAGVFDRQDDSDKYREQRKPYIKKQSRPRPVPVYLKLSAAGQLKTIEQFTQKASRVERVIPPSISHRPTLLVAPFDLPTAWYRNQLTAVNLADLMMASLNEDTRITLVDREQLALAINEMSLGTGINTRQTMNLGALLKANMVLYCTVNQDIKSQTTIMQMQVLDTRHASVLAQVPLELQADISGHFNPNQADVDLMTQTLPGLLDQALVTLKQIQDKVTIAPLFIRNTSNNDRLDHYQAKFHKIITRYGQQTDTHILQIAGLNYASHEQVLSLTGLAESDPNAWQYVADEYLWGYFKENSHPDNTAVSDIPVTITLYCWDGLNVPVELKEETTIKDFESGMEKLAEKLNKHIQPKHKTQICQGLQSEIANYLYAQAHANKVNGRFPKPGERQFGYVQFLMDLALFFDPQNAKHAYERCQLSPQTVNPHNPKQFIEQRQYTERLEQFLDRFAGSPGSNTKQGLIEYTQSLYILLKVHELPMESRALTSYHFPGYLVFQPDTPYPAVQQQLDETLNRCMVLQKYLAKLDQTDTAGNDKHFVKTIEKLAQIVTQMPVSHKRSDQVVKTLMVMLEQLNQRQKLHEEKKQRQRDLDKKQTTFHATAESSIENISSVSKLNALPILQQQIKRLKKEYPSDRSYKSHPLTFLRKVEPHPVQNLNLPNASMAVIPHQILGRIESSNYSRMGLNLEDRQQLFSDQKNICLLNDQRLNFFDVMAKPTKWISERIPQNPINDLLIHDDKIYITQADTGLLIIDLHNRKTQTWTTENGLLWNSPNQIAMVLNQLYVSYTDHRLSAIDLETQQVFERHIPKHSNFSYRTQGKSLLACGTAIIVDKNLIFDTVTGQSTALKNDHKLTYQTANNHAFWMTTENKLITLAPTSNEQKSWDLPVAKPDGLAATDDCVFLLYRQSTWYGIGEQKLPAGAGTINTNWNSYILLWDPNLEQVTGKIILPGDVCALSADHGNLWCLLDRNNSLKLVQIINPTAIPLPPSQTKRQFNPALKRLSSQQLVYSLTDMAYAGQLDVVMQWYQGYQYIKLPAQSDAQVLAASCWRCTKKQIRSLAKVMLGDNAVKNHMTLSKALRTCLALGRLDVFESLLDCLDLIGPEEYAKGPVQKKNAYGPWHSKITPWESQGLLLAWIKQAAMDYQQWDIYHRFDAYDLPAKFNHGGIWSSRHSEYLNFSSSKLDITPMAMAIRLEHRKAFDTMLKLGPNPLADDITVIPTALGSHTPYYIQQLLESWFVPMQRTNNLFLVNHKAMDAVYQWALQDDTSKRCIQILSIVNALEDYEQLDKLLAAVADPNDQQLISAFLRMNNLKLLDMLNASGWDVAHHTPVSCLDQKHMIRSYVLDWLIKHQYPLDQTDANGQTALMLKAQFGSAIQCYLLLEAGASIDLTDKNGRKAIDLTKQADIIALLEIYSQSGQESSEAASQIAPLRTYNASDKKLHQLILTSARNNDTQKLKEAIAKAEAKPQYQPFFKTYEYNPLMYTASRGDLEMSQKLIDLNPDYILGKQNEGWTPLMYAAANNHAAVVNLLLTHHAPWQVENKMHLTALELARLYHQEQSVQMFKKHGIDRKDGRVLMRLLTNGNINLFEQMIKSEGYDINAHDEKGNTVLFFALDALGNKPMTYLSTPTYTPDYPLALRILKLGGNINHKNLKGNTPLLQLLGKKYVGWHPQYKESETSIQKRINNNAQAIAFVLNHGAQLHITNHEGKNAQMLADENIRSPHLKQRITELLTGKIAN